MLHGIWYKIEDWYLNYSQEYFKSYRIALGWLQAWFWTIIQVTYSFIGVFFELRYQNVMENDTKLEDWIKRYLIQTYHRLSQEYLKSYRIAFRVAWFWTIIQLLIRLSAYFWICGMKMLHGIWYKLEDWIKRYLIQTYHRLSQEYFKSYSIAFIIQLLIHLSAYFWSCGMKCYMEFDTNWRIESRDILFKLTTGYLKSISSHIE